MESWERGLFLAEEIAGSRHWQKVRVAGVWGARKDGGRSEGLIGRAWKALRGS